MTSSFNLRSSKRHILLQMALMAVVCVALVAPARAQFVYLTNFAKTDNIYTNLNEQFPASGVGTPGSGVGTPNASFLFDPTTYTSANAIPGSNLTTNGATFLITSDATGRDFAEITGGNSLALTVNQNATQVYLLMASYNGTSVNVTFTGADSATETFTSLPLPDFNGGSTINQGSAVNGSLTNNQFVQTAFQVYNVGAGGTGNSTTGAVNYYNLVEVSFVLNTQLSSESLTSINLTSNGSTSLLLGASFTSVPEPTSLTLLGLGLPIAVCGLRRVRVWSARLVE